MRARIYLSRMDQQHSNGIYTYIGVLDNNDVFNGQGTLTYPSGKKLRLSFKTTSYK